MLQSCWSSTLNRNRAQPRGPVISSFGSQLSVSIVGTTQPPVMKTLARMPSSCNHLLLPSRLGEGGAFGATETRIWVDVSVSSRNSRTVSAPGICSDADALVRQHRFTELFHCGKLRAEPQPLFPGDVETSSERSSGLGSEPSAKQGLFQAHQLKGVSCERERYGQVV